MTTSSQVREFPIGPFRESAMRWLDAVGRGEPGDEATPSQAATVMLVRGEPLEVFMIERASTMDFAPSTWVFPGGRVDAADEDVVKAGLLDGFDAEDAGRDLGIDADAAGAVVVCALRELFEEAGVLLVDTNVRGNAVGDGADAGLAAETDGPAEAVGPDVELRTRLEAHEVTFVDVLAGRRLRADLVAAVDRWITPPFEKRRFDTWFFTALLPEGAVADAVSRESQRGRWVRPREMLDEMAAGHVRLLPPTRTGLERLTRAASASEALTQARAATFEPTRPEPLMGPDGPYLRARINL